jgi:hypothetical protein
VVAPFYPLVHILFYFSMSGNRGIGQRRRRLRERQERVRSIRLSASPGKLIGYFDPIEVGS